MNLTINDTRNLNVFVFNPVNGLCYNWTKGTFENFNAVAHVVPIPSVPNLPPVLSTFKNVFVQTVLAENPGCVAGLVTVDGSGNPTSGVDIINSPFPVSYPVAGGIK